MTEREFALNVVQRLQDAGHQALWAGGCVRDELLGLTPKDFDVATDARPEEVRQLFRRTIVVGLSFGVVEVLGPRHNGQVLKVQVATFRSDCQYSDGRRPDAVIFSSAREDALRRDFTINGMFFDPVKGELLDFVGGRQDLQDKILRAIGDPRQRFEEDKLRLLRGVRMATRFDLHIEPQTAVAVRAMAEQVTVVSAERIAQELRPLLVHPRRVRGLNLMRELDLIRPILPELFALQGFPPEPDDSVAGDLWDHVLRVLDGLGPAPSFPLALAALLHETGRPAVIAGSGAQDPVLVSAQKAEEICERLRLSNEETDRAVWLIARQRALCAARTLRLSVLKPLLAHSNIRELLTLHRADALAKGQAVDHVVYCENRLDQWTAEDLDPPPPVTGEDLKKMGLKPGPLFKRLLDAVREAQLEGKIATREEALALVQRQLKEWGVE
jgi:poly(A) polymerase